ncbi:hypothetical protein AAFF_G00372590 [Aldrovandia affinis]|uniref:Uncharacterized protein n=1 Tax=Aldrovandia affinis TaxID=143900 RepID=A0AAD7SG98_9TELE|nr:hypothetical protein AAFF_G00372590 [Aldrovandia affinis]
MSHAQEAESGEGPANNRAPPTQRHRPANARVGAGEGVRSGWRPCQQHSQGTEPAEETQNHRHGNQQRYRRHESSGRGGGRSRGSRGPAEEGGSQKQPRPGVARYRRAQQPRHKQKQQGEAEPHHSEEGKSGPALWHTGPGGDAGVLSGPQAEGKSVDVPQCQTEAGGYSSQAPPLSPPLTPPAHSPDPSEEVLNPRPSHCRHAPQREGEQCAEPTTEPHTESNKEPMAGPHSEPYAEPNTEPNPEPYSYTEGNAEPHIESYAEPCTESYTESYAESSTDAHVQEGQPCEEGGLGAGLWQQRAVGSRLHHYDGRSDGESDSPEKESEFPPSPPAGERAEVDFRRRRRSWSLDRALGEPQDEHAKLGELGLGEPQDEQAEVEDEPGRQRCGRADSLSLAIRDIKEAIQEVKTRTVRSPYTPEEPSEPIWVMRQDLSPTTECDLQPTPDGDSLDSGSASPLGAESTNRQQLEDVNDSIESPPIQESRKTLASFPTYVDVPGPCDPEDLIDGIIFAANYLGSTQLLSDKTPSKSVDDTTQRMAKSRKKCQQAPEGQTQLTTEVDLFISTQRIKVLNADSQEAMMDHPLRTISYIADIGDIVVLMARRKRPRPRSQGAAETSDLTQEGKGQCTDPAQEGRGTYNDPSQEGRGQYSDPTQDGRGQYKDSTQEERRQYRMICHVFESEDAQLIAQSIGQAFSVAYQEFLRANGINPEDLSQREYSDLLSTQDMYNDDLIHFSKSENCKDVNIEKQKGEILGVVVVESGWGSILPTVIIANMMHGGPAEKSGRLNIGDQIMSINGTSLVGLPLTTCQSIIKALKSQPRIKLNIVRCPPVTTVLIRRPDLRYQLGFSVQNGIICSLMRGGIAERGGVRVGHRIIEISSQSVVATPHERIVNILSSAVGEIHMKTMPAAMYRLLTGQEQPVYM